MCTREPRLVLVSLLIGWKRGERTLNQSLSEVMQNQSNSLITFDTQLKAAQCPEMQVQAVRCKAIWLASRSAPLLFFLLVYSNTDNRIDNRTLYNCVLSYLAFKWKWGWCWPCYDTYDMLLNLHKKSSEVSINTRSTTAPLSFKGQVTEHTTIKWTISANHCWKQLANAQVQS